jgi:hypothetical protein
VKLCKAVEQQTESSSTPGTVMFERERASVACRLGNLTETTRSQGMTLHAAFKYWSETYCFTFRVCVVLREASKNCIYANTARKFHCLSHKRPCDQARLKC